MLHASKKYIKCAYIAVLVVFAGALKKNSMNNIEPENLCAYRC